MYVKSVSWTTNNSKKKSNEHTKRFPVVFYLLEDGSFHSKRISRLEAIYYKTKICKRIKWYEVPWYKMQICKQKSLTCEFCEKKFTFLIKKNEKPECPHCLES